MEQHPSHDHDPSAETAVKPSAEKGLRQELEHKNAQLEIQTRQLTEILKINEALHLDLRLEEVLDRVARAIHRSLGFRRVLISLYDRDRHVFKRIAQSGLSPEEFDRARQQEVPKECFFQFFQEKYEVGNAFFVSHQEGVATEYDIKAEGMPEQSGGWHPDDYLLVPLVSADHRLLGVISVDNPADEQVPDLQTIGILELFANQAAQAVLNVILYERAKARAQALETLGTISKQIGAQLDFDLLLERMVDIIRSHLKSHYCAVLLWNEDQDSWQVAAPKATAPSLTVELNKVDHIIQQVARRGKPVISEQLEPPSGRGRAFQSALFSAFLPLMIQDKLIGILVIVGRQDMLFRDRDELFWNSLSDQMATAIGNARMYQNAKVSSITDGLTGLYNRRHFQERLVAEESRSRRHRHPFSVIMLDIDHFKNYNDTCGHPTGDKALTIIARLIRAEVRDIDIVARYGGEEFVMVLTETDKAGAWKVAERIRKKVSDHKFPHAQVQPNKRLTVSLGVAGFPDDGDDAKDVVERADEALYTAKKLGRDRVFLYGQSETAGLQ
jgi:diguanylate cyclase (GGDEF)-like protein